MLLDHRGRFAMREWIWCTVKKDRDRLRKLWEKGDRYEPSSPIASVHLLRSILEYSSMSVHWIRWSRHVSCLISDCHMNLLRDISFFDWVHNQQLLKRSLAKNFVCHRCRSQRRCCVILVAFDILFKANTLLYYRIILSLPLVMSMIEVAVSSLSLWLAVEYRSVS